MSLTVSAPGASPATAIELNGPADAAAKAVAAARLLPPPGQRALDGADDALSMLYSLVGRQQTLTMAIGQSSVESANRAQDAQLAQEKHSMIEQQKAAEQSGFWHDLVSVCETVAKVAGMVVTLVAGAVASIFTGGATAIAAVAVAAVLISGGLVVSATHCFGKDSDFVAMGAEIVASVVTCGAATGAVASSAAAQAAQVVQTAGQCVQGTATVVAGVSSVAAGKQDEQMGMDAADVQQAVNAIQREGRLVDAIVAGLKDSQKSTDNTLQLIAGAAHLHGQTMTLAASGRA